MILYYVTTALSKRVHSGHMKSLNHSDSSYLLFILRLFPVMLRSRWALFNNYSYASEMFSRTLRLL